MARARPKFARPNRDRKQTCLYLGPEDFERIGQIRMANFGVRTNTAAVRHALEVATRPPVEPPVPPDTTQIGLRILKWAESRLMCSVAEKKELRALAKELYEIVSVW